LVEVVDIRELLLKTGELPQIVTQHHTERCCAASSLLQGIVESICGDAAAGESAFLESALHATGLTDLEDVATVAWRGVQDARRGRVPGLGGSDEMVVTEAWLHKLIEVEKELDAYIKRRKAKTTAMIAELIASGRELRGEEFQTKSLEWLAQLGRELDRRPASSLPMGVAVLVESCIKTRQHHLEHITMQALGENPSRLEYLDRFGCSEVEDVLYYNHHFLNGDNPHEQQIASLQQYFAKRKAEVDSDANRTHTSSIAMLDFASRFSLVRLNDMVTRMSDTDKAISPRLIEYVAERKVFQRRVRSLLLEGEGGISNSFMLATDSVQIRDILNEACRIIDHLGTKTRLLQQGAGAHFTVSGIVHVDEIKTVEAASQLVVNLQEQVGSIQDQLALRKKLANEVLAQTRHDVAWLHRGERGGNLVDLAIIRDTMHHAQGLADEVAATIEARWSTALDSTAAYSFQHENLRHVGAAEMARELENIIAVAEAVATLYRARRNTAEEALEAAGVGDGFGLGLFGERALLDACHLALLGGKQREMMLLRSQASGEGRYHGENVPLVATTATAEESSRPPMPLPHEWVKEREAMVKELQQGEDPPSLPPDVSTSQVEAYKARMAQLSRKYEGRYERWARVIKRIMEDLRRLWEEDDTRGALREWQLGYLRHSTRSSPPASPILQYSVQAVRDSMPGLEAEIAAHEALIHRVRSASQLEIDSDIAEITDMLGSVFMLDDR